MVCEKVQYAKMTYFWRPWYILPAPCTCPDRIISEACMPSLHACMHVIHFRCLSMRIRFCPVSVFFNLNWGFLPVKHLDAHVEQCFLLYTVHIGCCQIFHVFVIWLADFNTVLASLSDFVCLRVANSTTLLPAPSSCYERRSMLCFNMG